jgi:hypothetical protein
VTLRSPCTRDIAAAAFLAALLISACGAPTATVTPSSSASASSSAGAAPQPFAATGFRTNIPAGWQDQTANQSAVASVSGSGVVLMLLESPDRGLIVARTTPQPVADDQLAQYVTSITPAGATNVSRAEPVDIAGMSGVVVTFVVTPTSGAAQENEAMVVNRAGNTYEIVLTTAQVDFAQDAGGLQEILNTWRWA